MLTELVIYGAPWMSRPRLRILQHASCNVRMTGLLITRSDGWRLVAGAIVCLLTLFAVPVANAQARAQRAREACDAAASRHGYRILRADTAKTQGTTYELPLHVMHGAGEADVICRYDTERGVAELPQWDERAGQPARTHRGNAGRRTTGMSREAFIARQECESFINSRPGFRVQRLGTPVARGAGRWDVPLTVRQDDGTDEHATCRYNAASGTVSLRRR